MAAIGRRCLIRTTARSRRRAPQAGRQQGAERNKLTEARTNKFRSYDYNPRVEMFVGFDGWHHSPSPVPAADGLVGLDGVVEASRCSPDRNVDA